MKAEGADREGEGDAPDWEPATLPRRDAEWEPEFWPRDRVELEAESAVFVTPRSGRRRLVALVVTALAIAWLLDAIIDGVRYVAEVGDAPERVLGVMIVLPLGFRLLIGGLATWLVWRWAHRPVAR